MRVLQGCITRYARGEPARTLRLNPITLGLKLITGRGNLYEVIYTPAQVKPQLHPFPPLREVSLVWLCMQQGEHISFSINRVEISNSPLPP